MIEMKNQGQSTVEYLLVIAVASFFVLSLAVYMNPKLSSMLSDMEDVVAAKIRGGEWVSHYKGGAGGGGASVTKGEGSEAGSDEGAAGEGGAGGIASGTSSSHPEMTDLDKDSGQASKGVMVSGGGGGGGGEEESSTGVISQGGRATRSSQVSKDSQEQKPDGKKEKSVAEEDKSSKGRGILYQEGQEETAMGGSSFNWMRLILMLLIFIVVVFMVFEIYKSVKLSRK